MVLYWVKLRNIGGSVTKIFNFERSTKANRIPLWVKKMKTNLTGILGNFVFYLSPGNRMITEDPCQWDKACNLPVTFGVCTFSQMWKYGTFRSPWEALPTKHGPAMNFQHIEYPWLNVNLVYSKCWKDTLDWLSYLWGLHLKRNT